MSWVVGAHTNAKNAEEHRALAEDFSETTENPFDPKKPESDYAKYRVQSVEVYREKELERLILQHQEQRGKLLAAKEVAEAAEQQRCAEQKKKEEEESVRRRVQEHEQAEKKIQSEKEGNARALAEKKQQELQGAAVYQFNAQYKAWEDGIEQQRSFLLEKLADHGFSPTDRSGIVRHTVMKLCEEEVPLDFALNESGLPITEHPVCPVQAPEHFGESNKNDWSRRNKHDRLVALHKQKIMEEVGIFYDEHRKVFVPKDQVGKTRPRTYSLEEACERAGIQL